MKAGQLHLDVVKPYVGIVGKEDKIRTLYLLPRTAAHLKKYLHEFHGDAPCAEALATLEGDNDSKTEKKWKKPDGSLRGFCGLPEKKLKNIQTFFE